jgi:hypothetical protein
LYSNVLDFQSWQSDWQGCICEWLVLLGFLIAIIQQQAMVHDAEECSGPYAAIKKSRVSLRVKRTMLRHEARVLQLLQGHPAIPTLFGYQRLPHFEYIAVDLLGQHMRGICKPGYSLKIGTVASIAEQMVFRALIPL